MIEYAFSLQDLEYFLLIMTRVTCFLFIAPFFSMDNTPARVKIALGVCISYLIYQLLVPRIYPEYNTVIGYAVIVGKEAATGLLIGYGAQICTSIVNFAGRLVDMETGLSMVNQMDPTTKENATITGVFFQYLVMLMMIISGVYQFVLGALVDSFSLIPINGAVFHSEELVSSILIFLKDYIVIGFRICLDRKSTRLNSSHIQLSRMPSSA